MFSFQWAKKLDFRLAWMLWLWLHPVCGRQPVRIKVTQKERRWRENCFFLDRRCICSTQRRLESPLQFQSDFLWYNCCLISNSASHIIIIQQAGALFFTDRICVALQHTESVTAHSTCLIRVDVKVEVFLKEMHSWLGIKIQLQLVL